MFSSRRGHFFCNIAKHFALGSVPRPKAHVLKPHRKHFAKVPWPTKSLLETKSLQVSTLTFRMRIRPAL